MTGLWTEVCVDLADDRDARRRATTSTSSRTAAARLQRAHDAALSRMVQAGAMPADDHRARCSNGSATGQNREHYDALMGLLKEHAGAYGSGVEYAYTMVHKAPQSAKSPQKRDDEGEALRAGSTPTSSPAGPHGDPRRDHPTSEAGLRSRVPGGAARVPRGFARPRRACLGVHMLAPAPAARRRAWPGRRVRHPAHLRRRGGARRLLPLAAVRGLARRASPR